MSRAGPGNARGRTMAEQHRAAPVHAAHPLSAHQGLARRSSVAENAERSPLRASGRPVAK